MNPLEFTDLAQALFEEAGDALFLFDPDNDQILAVNPLAVSLSGFSKQELLKMPVSWLYRYEGRSSQHQIQRHAQHSSVFLHNRDGFELRTHDDGRWIPVNLTITRLHVQPKTLALITARDVREQREAHDRVKAAQDELRRVLASVSDCVWSAEIDAAGKWTYRYLSPVIEQITSRPPEFSRAGPSTGRAVVAPRTGEHCVHAVALAGERGQSSQEEYRIVQPRWHLSMGPRQCPGQCRQRRQIQRRSACRHSHGHHGTQAGRGPAPANDRLRARGPPAVDNGTNPSGAIRRNPGRPGPASLLAWPTRSTTRSLLSATTPWCCSAFDLGALQNYSGSLYREADAALAHYVPGLWQRIRDLDAAIDISYTLQSIEGLLSRSREGLQRIQQIVKDPAHSPTPPG